MDTRDSLNIFPVDPGIAKRFTEGKLTDHSPIIYESDKSTIYRCFERDESIPGITGTKLRLDYRDYTEGNPNRPNQLRFEYTQPSADQPEEERTVAEMHLGILDSHTFKLEHRYVRPDLRTRSGLGSRLLKTAEGWLQQVADSSNNVVTIRLQVGQDSVIRWIQKMGYSVQDDQQELLDELTNHPERFVRGDVVLSDASQLDGIIKDAYTFRVDKPGRHMEDAVRLTFEKRITPKGQES